MLLEKGLPGFSFFDFTLVGLAGLLTCLLVMSLRLSVLPNSQQEEADSASYFVEAEVKADSKLIGNSVEVNGLRNLDALFLVEVIRQGQLISPVTPDEILHSGDKLIFCGDVSKVLVLQQFDGLTLFAEKDGFLHQNLTEVLIKPGAAIVGKSIKDAGFRARFDAAVVAIRREGDSLSGKLGDIVIQSGDFLMLAVGHDFAKRTNLSKNFFILSGVKADNMLSGIRERIVLWGFLGTLGISLLFDIALFKCFVFYLATLIATKCLSVNEIKRRFPLELWVIVVSALSLAQALDNTGVTKIVAGMVETNLQHQSTYIAFVGVFF